MTKKEALQAVEDIYEVAVKFVKDTSKTKKSTKKQSK